MQMFSVSFYIISLGPKYISEHPILEHPQSMFFPQFERLRL